MRAVNGLNPVVRGKYSDRLRMSVCVAIARTGNMPIEGSVNAEHLLCTALGGPPRSFLFFRLPRGLLFGEQVNGLICRVLTQIGGALADQVLADIAERDQTGLAQHAQRSLDELRKRRAAQLEAADSDLEALSDRGGSGAKPSD